MHVYVILNPSTCHNFFYRHYCLPDIACTLNKVFYDIKLASNGVETVSNGAFNYS